MKFIKDVLNSIFGKVMRPGKKSRAKTAWSAHASLTRKGAQRLQRHLDFARRLDPKYLSVVRREKLDRSYPAKMAGSGLL